MNVNNLTFTSKENPGSDEIDELRMSLRAFNNKFTGEYERTSLIHQVRNSEGTLLGGAYGYISWGWLYIDLLWVDDSLRGTGMGTRLIKEIEKLANEKDVYCYYLGTTSFQALDFYKKMGYQVCGEIEGLPPGHTNYFLKKTDH